ncbi:hypothetical protein FHS19_002142 [Paenibacillus rhizosphaerae]|uniref:Uncharacterized protein n=1 Tax=Paenibacillus rhizosphaerae TaxID=297318 RepID=A0A839TQ26_9BACL|nr:hypothetical protein [Paenibacillus rhizosphaerae]MBB3127488.1 hypothetical protein [Paenibacillus rhizosphaerae]
MSGRQRAFGRAVLGEIRIGGHSGRYGLDDECEAWQQKLPGSTAGIQGRYWEWNAQERNGSHFLFWKSGGSYVLQFGMEIAANGKFQQIAILKKAPLVIDF